jgi:hypothetical protein
MSARTRPLEVILKTSLRFVLAGALVLALAPGAARVEAGDALPTRRMAIGPGYGAGAFHRWLWGSDYRDLWTTPVQVEVLDLASTGGGLTPVQEFGSSETLVLAMRGSDGRDYTFRSLDKDPVSLVPPELRDTWVRDLVQDQIAAGHPLPFLVADELMKAAGILHAPARLVVMPDDERLGRYRQRFAGIVGQFYEYPQGRSARNPGFQGAERVLGFQEFHGLIAARPEERPDVRAFLKARLFDMMIGDWDRHRRQWRWAKFEGRGGWQPIPEDRDLAFSRFEGLVLDLERARMPRLQDYDDSYPGMTGLTWLGAEHDRRHLAGVERPLFEEVAKELQSQMTDAVIQRAVRRLPPEYVELDGKALEHDLRGRRDGLLKAAHAYYEHLADKVKVYLTAEPEVVDVERVANGHDLVVRAWVRGPGGERRGEPFFERTLHGKETDEVHIYLGGGDDHVTTVGKPNGIAVRVIGGGGRSVVDDTNGGGTHFSDDSGVGRLLPGRGSSLDRRRYVPPPVPEETPWLPPRDWGRDFLVRPWLSYGGDLGGFLGAQADIATFGFRKDPYASRHVLRAGWLFDESTFRADYRAHFHVENRGWSWGFYGYASGTETSRYFGLGNATSDGGDPRSDFFDTEQDEFGFTPTISIPVLRNVTFTAGPTVKYSSARSRTEETLLSREQPYGYGDFGEVGAQGQLELDTRDRRTSVVVLDPVGYPRHGAHVIVRGQVVPGLWDVEETFGSVKGKAAVYLSPSSERAPTLALRVGGERVFGRYPYFEAAYIGGDLAGSGEFGADSPVRGLARHRYGGDGTLYGGADLRMPVSRFRFVFPGTWGLLAFSDAGRVYLDGDESDKWHTSYGGGLWFAWLDRANVMSATFARSEGENKFYLGTGFSF